MRTILLSFAALLLGVMTTDKASCNKKGNAPGDSIMILATGNYWVYRDSTFKEGKLLNTDLDTVIITGEREWNGRKVFIFNDGKEWYLQHDTIYQLGAQRSGEKFPSPVFFSTNKESQFNYVLGGDVVIRKTISRMSECPLTEWKPTSCFMISDRCDGYTIVAYGIGIIREKMTDCSSGFTTKTLVSFRTSKR